MGLKIFVPPTRKGATFFSGFELINRLRDIYRLVLPVTIKGNKALIWGSSITLPSVKTSQCPALL